MINPTPALMPVTVVEQVSRVRTAMSYRASEPVMLHRSQVFPLRLNRAQAEYMAKAAGTARFAYNWALTEWKRQAKLWWDSGKVEPYPSAFALQKQFNAIKREQFPWITEVSSAGADSAILSVGEAFARYRAGLGRYPKPKTRTSKRAFTACARQSHMRIDGKHLVLLRVGRVRLVGDVRWPEASPHRASIVHRGGRWHVSISFQLPDAESTPRKGYAGVDLGIASPLTVTSGEMVLHLGMDLAQRLNVERRKLRRANRRLSRRQRGSGRLLRAKQRVSRVHQRMANIRTDFQHKATHLIGGLAGTVGVETLGIRGMMSNGRLARSIADVGFFEIKRQLKYKSDQVVEADRFYPSSKTCSACGSIKSDLKLSDRTYRCECGFEGDRDENAARNLEHMAANCAVPARGVGSSAPKRKLRLSSLTAKREAVKAVQ